MAKVLIIGSGGREHAFTWKISQSDLVEKIFVCPGNAGTNMVNKAENIDIHATDIDALLSFAKQKSIDLTIVGPEAPLALGISDIFNQNQIACFGPSKDGAQIESSKSWCKNLLNKYNIPTAKSEEFDDFSQAKTYLERCSFPQVIKVDGLASGKGVFIVSSIEQAVKIADDILNNSKFGNAGEKIIIEEFLYGQEASYMVMANGSSFIALASSQDHKARDNGNKGPNTGGMGALSPSPIVDKAMQDFIETTIITPTLQAMQEIGIQYTGFLYAGLMITKQGPKVLEFNARMGDPETQAILFRMQGDFFDAIQKVQTNNFSEINLSWQNSYSLNVVMASNDYPFSYPKGEIIEGLNDYDKEDTFTFHAGTKHNNLGQVITDGGRVLNVTAKSTTLEQARKLVYEAIDKIWWPSAFYRTDIGLE